MNSLACSNLTVLIKIDEKGVMMRVRVRLWVDLRSWIVGGFKWVDFGKDFNTRSFCGNLLRMTRSRHHTGFAALWAVAAELSRQGYDVTITMGNTPKVDIFGAVPGGQHFSVQVKGISSTNGFYIDKPFFDGDQPNLYLVVVLVPPADSITPFRFFVLTHAEAVYEFSKMRKEHKDGTPYKEGWGLDWGSITPYEGQWQKFPERSNRW